MKVYLSHITALRFWRAWSILRPLTLQEFHSTGKVADANLFPSNIYQTSAVLRDCAIRECDIHSLFDELPEMPELRFCLKEWPPAFLSVSCLPLAMSSVGAIRDQRKRVFRWCVVLLPRRTA